MNWRVSSLTEWEEHCLGAGSWRSKTECFLFLFFFCPDLRRKWVEQLPRGRLHRHVRSHAATAALQQYSLKCKKCVSQKKKKQVIKNTINPKKQTHPILSYPLASWWLIAGPRRLCYASRPLQPEYLAFRTRKKNLKQKTTFKRAGEEKGN